MLRIARFDEPPETATALLTASGLCCALNGRTILRDVALSAVAGESIAIHGANGAGKTTLLKCLTGRLRPTSGEVCWLGRPASASPAMRRQIGFVGHEVSIYAELTPYENLEFAARMYGLPEPRRRARIALQQIGLDQQAGQLAGRLSRGMQQRVSITRALIHEPPIVILDEPFTSLDEDGRDWLAEWMTERRANAQTLIWTSHEQELSRQLATRRLQICNGSLIDARHQRVSTRRCSA